MHANRARYRTYIMEIRSGRNGIAILMSTMRIGIYGAYGFSGQLIGKALVAAGFSPLLAGRDPLKLSALQSDWARDLPILTVRPEDAGETDAMLSRLDLLIQTAGPYALLPPAFSDHLAAWEGIILDVCGEYSVVEELARCVEARPREWRGLRVPACGFESFPALWLAEIVLDGGWPATRIRTYYSHTDSRFSPGTRASARVISGEPKRVFAGGALRLATKEEWVLTSPVPAGFPGKAALLSPLPEIVLLPRRYGIADCGSYALVPEGAARFLDTGGGEASPQSVPSRRPRTVPGPHECARHGFTVVLMAWDADEDLRWAKLHGRDPYAASVWLVRRLVETLVGMQSRPIGFRTPEQILPAGMGLREAVNEIGFDLELGNGVCG